MQGWVRRRAGVDGAQRQGLAPGVWAGGDAVVDGGAEELLEPVVGFGVEGGGIVITQQQRVSTAGRGSDMAAMLRKVESHRRMLIRSRSLRKAPAGTSRARGSSGEAVEVVAGDPRDLDGAPGQAHDPFAGSGGEHLAPAARPMDIAVEVT